MISFVWDPAKNERLKRDRGVSFEDILQDIQAGRIVDRVLHPNQQRYPGQKIFIIDHKDYCCLVPFVESGDSIFLKTIIPSRKKTKEYGRGRKSHDDAE